MAIANCWLLTAMLLFPAGSDLDNPWIKKAAPILRESREHPSADNLRKGLDAAWRADDWQAGLAFADLARERFATDASLAGLTLRALWRGGRLAEAEAAAQKFSTETDDRVALVTLVGIHSARADLDAAGRFAARIEALKPQTAEEVNAIFGVRLAQNRLEGAAALVRKATDLAKKENGYPEIYVEESVGGLAEFLDAVGSQPLNQTTKFGSAEMPPLPLLNLPYVEATINGHGPYRFILDTGGSIMLSVDDAVAEECKLKLLGQASIRGVSGTDESHQAVVDELRIGGIACKRVMTRVFGLRASLMGAADGLIGTGIFADARMTMALHDGRLVVAPSSTAAASGTATKLRLVGDAKMVVPIELEGGPCLTIFDSGADVVALAPSRLRALFPGRKIQTIETPVMGVGNSALPKISMNPGVQLVIAGRKYENYSGLGLDVLDTTLSPILGLQCDVLVGMAVFRDMKSITVDFPKCKLWIEWGKGE